VSYTQFKWFKDHGHSAAQIQEIKKLVVTCWNETYKGDEEPPPATEASRRGKVSDFIVTLSLDNNAFISDEVKVG
jgi:hypothetical protein